MGKAYFDYEIRNTMTNKKVNNSDFMMLVERNYIDKTKRFEYSLVLVIKRHKIKDDYVFPFSSTDKNDPFVGKYLFVYHNYKKNGQFDKRYKLTKPSKEEGIFTDSYSLVANENPELIQHMYIKYTFKDLPENAISGMGVFGFSDDRNVEPAFEHRYNYYTEFKEKIYYFYSLTKNGNDLNITLPQFPHVEEDIHLKVAYSDKYIYKIDNILPDYEIVIPKNGTFKKESYRVTLPKEVQNNHFFRLIIQEKKIADLFLLVNRKEQDSFKPAKIYFDNWTDDVKLCPYCARRMNINKNNKEYYKNPYHFCDGTNVGQGSRFVIKDKTKKIKTAVLCKDYSLKESKNDMLLLPKSTYRIDRKSTLVSLLGLPSSGKSVFLSTLLGLQNGKNANPRYFNLFAKRYRNEFVLQDLLYVEKNAVFEGEVELAEKSSQIMGEYSSNGRFIDFRINAENENGLFRKTSDKTRFYPFIMESSKTSAFVMKDIAGEDAEKEIRDLKNDLERKTERIDNSDAYIIFISPDDYDFKKTISRVTQAETIKPIAFVLTKFDQVIEKIPNFDANSACLNDATYDMIDKSTLSGSTLEKNIEQASLEIKQIIKDRVKNFPMDMIEKNCKNYKFFAISSLGNANCLISNNGKRENGIGFYSVPFRIELPVLWLLFQTGVIG